LHLCLWITDQIAGGSYPEDNNGLREAIFLAHFPSGTSMKNLMYISQQFGKNALYEYDEGPEKNLELYG